VSSCELVNCVKITTHSPTTLLSPCEACGDSCGQLVVIALTLLTENPHQEFRRVLYNSVRHYCSVRYLDGW